MRQYYILTLNPNAAAVFGFIQTHKLTVDVHLNRTRFWIEEDSPILTQFLLRFAHCCPYVDESLDLITGQAI